MWTNWFEPHYDICSGCVLSGCLLFERWVRVRDSRSVWSYAGLGDSAGGGHPLWLVQMLLLITEQKRNWKCICFKNVDFPPQTLSLAHSVAWVILYWLWVWQKTKKSRKEALVWGWWWRGLCSVLLDVFIHFYVCIISSHVSTLGGAKIMCGWLIRESMVRFQFAA